MVNPTSNCWTTAKRVIRYLKGTIDFDLIYEKGLTNLNIIGYNDSDFSVEVKDKKSTRGHICGLLIT